MDFGSRLVENELKNTYSQYRSEVIGVAVSSQMWIDDSLYSRYGRPGPSAVQMGASYSGDTLVLMQSFASGGGVAAVTFRVIGRKIIGTLDVLKRSPHADPHYTIKKAPLVFEKAVLNEVPDRDDTTRLKGRFKFQSENVVIDAEESATQKNLKLRIAMDLYFTQVHPEISDYGEDYFR